MFAVPEPPSLRLGDVASVLVLPLIGALGGILLPRAG